VIRFYINQSGQVENLKIISNDSNEALATCSVDAIYQAKFLPPPSELAPSLENGRYEADFSFTINPYQ
jgi:outer membrane biosynthesis protein TonB